MVYSRILIYGMVLHAHNVYQNGAHWSLQRPWVFNAAAPFFSNTRSQLSTFSYTQHIQSLGSSMHPLFQKLGLGHAAAHAISNACNECTGKREAQRAYCRWAGSQAAWNRYGRTKVWQARVMADSPALIPLVGNKSRFNIHYIAKSIYLYIS